MKLPRALELVLVAYGAFALLHAFYLENPLRPAAVAACFAPTLPPARHAWPNVTERLGRLWRGHAAAAAVLVGALGSGLVVLDWMIPLHSAGGESAMFGLGLGLGAAILGWLGAGLVGLWGQGLAMAVVGCGGALSWRRRAVIRRAGPRASGSAGRWLILSVGAAAALNLALVPAAWIVATHWSGEHPLFAVGGACVWVGAILVPWLVGSVRWSHGSGQVTRGRWTDGWLVLALSVEIWLAILLQAVMGEAPERFYDAQVYHLALPSLFAMVHKVTGLPELLHAAFPAGGPMVYGWLWLLGGEAAARAWRLWLLGLTTWLVYRLASRDGGEREGVTAAALFLTCPLAALNAMQTTPDLELCFAVFLALLAARTLGGTRRAAVTGALAGLAWSLKITTLFFLPGLLAAAATGRRGRGPWLRAVRAFGLVAACWVAPWWARDAVIYGNPVYPYAQAAFPSGRQWVPARRLQFEGQASGRALEGRGETPRLPWRLFFGRTSENFLGPALLLALPVAILYPPSGGTALAAGFVGASALATWIVFSNVLRYALPAWGLLGIFASAGVWRLGGKRPWLARAVLLVLVMIGASNLGASLEISHHMMDPTDFLAGRESGGQFLDRHMINGYVSVAGGFRLPPDSHARVMLVGETRGLYWDVPFINHSVYDVEAFEEALRASRDPAQFAKRLRQRATHLFFNDRESSRLKFRFAYPILEFTPRERLLLDGLAARWLDETADDGRFCRLFSLRRTARTVGPGPRPPLTFDAQTLRNEFEGVSTITWQGGGQIQLIKNAVEQ